MKKTINDKEVKREYKQRVIDNLNTASKTVIKKMWRMYSRYLRKILDDIRQVIDPRVVKIWIVDR